MTEAKKETPDAKKQEGEEDVFSEVEHQLLDAAARGEEVDASGAEDGADANGDASDNGNVKKKTEAVEPSIEDLKKQLAEEKSAREAAERKAKDAEETGNKAKNSAIEAAEARLLMAEEKLKSDKDAAAKAFDDAEKEYGDAYDAGDKEKVLAANRKMFDAKLKLARLEGNELGLQNYRKNFDENKKKIVEAPEDQGEYLTDKQLEDYTPEARKWINGHPQFRQSEEFRRKAIKAHHKALGNDITPDTEEYFKFLEEETGLREPEEDTQVDDATDAEPAKKPAPKKPIPTTPPSRDLGGTKKPGGRFVKLTAEELDAAETCGMSPDEYRVSKYGA